MSEKELASIRGFDLKCGCKFDLVFYSQLDKLFFASVENESLCSWHPSKAIGPLSLNGKRFDKDAVLHNPKHTSNAVCSMLGVQMTDKRYVSQHPTGAVGGYYIIDPATGDIIENKGAQDRWKNYTYNEALSRRFHDDEENNELVKHLENM